MWIVLALGALIAFLIARAHAMATGGNAQLPSNGDDRIMVVEGVQRLTPTTLAITSQYLADKFVTWPSELEKATMTYSQNGVLATIVEGRQPGADDSVNEFVLGYRIKGDTILAHLSGPYLAAVPTGELKTWAFDGSPWAVAY